MSDVWAVNLRTIEPSRYPESACRPDLRARPKQDGKRHIGGGESLQLGVNDRCALSADTQPYKPFHLPVKRGFMPYI